MVNYKRILESIICMNKIIIGQKKVKNFKQLKYLKFFPFFTKILFDLKNIKIEFFNLMQKKKYSLIQKPIEEY